MDRKTKGRLGEAKVACYFIENEYEIYTPYSDNAKYDMIVLKDGILQRVSIKYCSAKNANGSWRVSLCQVSRRANNKTNVVKFNGEEFDLLAIYIHPEDRVVLIDTKDLSNKSEYCIKPR